MTVIKSPRSRLFSFCGLALCALMPLLAFGAVKRSVDVAAPRFAKAGTQIKITIFADTEGVAGEQIGFLQAEYSVDGGSTWITLCYDTNVGTRAQRPLSPKVGAAGTKTLVRVRVAFRSSAGDVDYTGKPIAWDGSWKNWETPPAKLVDISVGK